MAGVPLELLAGGVGHDLRHFQPVPLYIARALGGRKWDVDGHEYVDFLLGNGALLLGHADPEIIDYPIAGNDDAIRAIRVILQKLVDAIVSASGDSSATAQAEMAGVSA